MIALRRAEERSHLRRRKREEWLTFYPEDRKTVFAGGFGLLEALNEERLAPGAEMTLHTSEDAEIVTYVYDGILAHEDSTGRSGLTRAGEFQRMTAGRGGSHTETNASRTEWAHFFQLALRPSTPGFSPGYEQRRFCVAERRGVLCVVASADGRSGSLRIHQDAMIYSAVLDPGQHVVHELATTRSGWVHVVRGAATLGDLVLSAGDGAGVAADRAVSVTARTSCEILLLDLAEAPAALFEGHEPVSVATSPAPARFRLTWARGLRGPRGPRDCAESESARESRWRGARESAQGGA